MLTYRLTGKDKETQKRLLDEAGSNYRTKRVGWKKRNLEIPKKITNLFRRSEV